MITQWGYEIVDDKLPEILTLEEFNEMTSNKYVGDERVSNILNSVISSIRNYVGWHLADSIECIVTYTFDDLHITKYGRDLLIQLPSRCSTSINKILINDTELDITNYYLKTNGILRLYDVNCNYSRYNRITIYFNSGLIDLSSLKNLICFRMTNTLNGPVGVKSESAGGVSISYSDSYVAGSSPISLLTADKEYLDTFRIKELL